MTPPDSARKLRPNSSFMLSHPAHIIAQGFGSGLSPLMPGTIGTLLSWFSFIVLSSSWPGVFTQSVWASLIIGGFVVGIWACHGTGARLGVFDHGSMVWDEIIAFWLVLLVLTPASFSTQLWAFLWFRFFDAVKPPPICHVERRFKRGFGVMADDMVAAFFTLLVFAVWRAI